jgi:hypothetical protein
MHEILLEEADVNLSVIRKLEKRLLRLYGDSE